MRIAHFTDIHVTERPSRVSWSDLFSKRFLGWANLKLGGRYGHFRDAAEIAGALVKDLEGIRPDHVVSTGDLTGISLPSEFEAARLALQPLLADARVTGIPGNHDVYVRSAVREKLYEAAFGAWTRTDFAPGDFPEETRGVYPYPLVRFLCDEAVLLCLRDVRPNPFHDSSGLVGPLQLRALERLLADPRVARRTKLLGLHYGLCRAAGSPDSHFHGLRDARAVRDIAVRGGIALVLHGHLHGRFVIPRGPLSPVPISNPGSLASRHPRHARAYHVYTVGGGRIELAARRYDDEARAFVAWPEAPGSGQIV